MPAGGAPGAKAPGGVPRAAGRWTCRPIGESCRRRLAATGVWTGSDTAAPPHPKPLAPRGRLWELRHGQEGNGGKGGVGHWLREVPHSRLSGSPPRPPHQLCPFGVHVAEEGEASSRCVCPQTVSSVWARESCGQAGRPRGCSGACGFEMSF